MDTEIINTTSASVLMSFLHGKGSEVGRGPIVGLKFADSANTAFHQEEILVNNKQKQQICCIY